MSKCLVVGLSLPSISAASLWNSSYLILFLDRALLLSEADAEG